ncbi:MAG TPA: PilZ domain-containing protein [Sphingobium sp.]|jgi:hypothetical protein|nr:PilZ domain-containing protein [Sphingobium sp.]
MNSRASKRDSLFLITVLHDDQGREVAKAKVRNLSATGMLVEPDGLLEDGQRLRCSLRGIGDVAGTVVRCDGNKYGVQFDATIDPAEARKPVVHQPNSEAPLPYIKKTIFKI